MQFSLAKILLFTAFASLIVAAKFAMSSLVGFIILSSITLFVLPPFLWVGAFNTKGVRQAFFLDAIVTGIPHFVFCVYILVSFIILGLPDLLLEGWDEQLYEMHNQVHFGGILLGALGGLSGMCSWFFVRPKAVSTKAE